MSQHVFEDHARVQSHLGVLVPVDRQVNSRWSFTLAHTRGTHPLRTAKMMSSLWFKYSTVGQRVPICRRSRWVKT